ATYIYRYGTFIKDNNLICPRGGIEVAIKYEKEILRVDQLIGEELSQVLIEGELVIPEDKPEIAKVLDIGATVYGTGKEVVQDRVMVEGVIAYNLLYIDQGDNRTVVTIDHDTSFTQYVEMPGAKPRMRADVSFELEHIDYDLEDGKRLNLKTVLDIACKVEHLLELEILKAFSHEGQIQALKEPLRLTSSVGDGSGQTIIREDVEIPDDMPSVVEVLRKDAKVKLLEKKATDNRIIAHGEIDLKLLYYSEEPQDPIQVLQYQIPFNHFVEVEGAYQGMDCEVKVDIQEMDVSLRQDVIGDIRVLSIDMMLFMEGRVFEAKEQETISDAYSPGAALDLTKSKILLTHTIGEDQVQISIKDNLQISEDMPKAARILYSEAKPSIADYRIMDGKVVMDGVLMGVLLYQPENLEMPINSLDFDIPFSHSIEIEGIDDSMDCSCETWILYLTHTLLSPEELELKATIVARGQVTANVEKEVLLDIEETEQEQGEDSGIYIYFVQPGDDLWSVAKRYNTTINNIVRYNEIENRDTLEVGSKIIIFKRLDAFIA
ncbi:MAG TPA: SPOCS domain-containing protein, partial [Clostridia bacterium]|nr:SPOCS domain-containing protein [Clostridia bacterium]